MLPRTFQEYPHPVTLQRPLNTQFDHQGDIHIWLPGDFPIWRPKDSSVRHPKSVSWRGSLVEALRTFLKGPSENVLKMLWVRLLEVPNIHFILHFFKNSMQYSRSYFEPNQASMMELFSKTDQRVLAVNYFCKETQA